MSSNPASLGYIFLPFPGGASLGYAGLDVYLAADASGSSAGDANAPEEAGFVPAQINLNTWDNGGVLDGGGGMGHSVIAAHTPSPGSHAVAPGFVTVRERSGDGQLAAYCFGGTVAWGPDPGHPTNRTPAIVHCRLTSPAPILNLSEEGLDWSENSVLRVVDGLESELAALRAQFDDAAEATLYQRLAATDPRLLYAAALDLAHRSFAALPEVLRTEHFWDEYNTLVRAWQEARQAPWWPEDPTILAVLGKAVGT